MMKLNKKMASEFGSAAFSGKPLDSSLVSLLEDGFIVQDGCVFLSAFFSSETSVTKNSFPDNTGFECFVNSFHIDDYVEDNYLENTMLFIEKLFLVWRLLDYKMDINVIVSLNDFGAVVRFHVIRECENWISSDLEEYEEGILIANSSDVERPIFNFEKSSN
jgi:hypothetical protein